MTRVRTVLAYVADRMDPALAVIGLAITQVRIHRADDAWPYAPLLLGTMVAVAPALVSVRRVVPILASVGLALAAVMSLLVRQTDWVVIAGCALALWSVAERCRLRSAIATLVTVTVLLPLLATEQWWMFYSTAYRQIEDSGTSSDGTTWYEQGIPGELLDSIMEHGWSWWLSIGLATVWSFGLVAGRRRTDRTHRTLGEQLDDLGGFLTNRRHRLAIDLVIATVMTSIVLVGIRRAQLWDGNWWAAPQLIIVFVAYSPMVLTLRRIVPVVPCLWLGAASGVAYWQANDFWPLLAAFAIALYTLASLRPLHTTVPVAVGILIAIPVFSANAGERVLTFLFPSLRNDIGDIWIPYSGTRYSWEYEAFLERNWPVSLSLTMALPVCLGILTRLAKRISESRGLEAKLRRQDTRTTVARDLHDVIAHHVNVMVIQAEDGLDLVPRERADLAVRLERIGDAGRLALAELDRTLAALRNPDGRPDPELAPQPMFADIRRLVAALDTPELTIELELTGDLDSVPAGHQVTAYRLIQEALTNVVRHADATKAVVTVTGGTDGLQIRVTDDGVGFGPSDANGRHGLTGMRERVQIHDGTFDVDSAPNKGTTITAWIPR